MDKKVRNIIESYYSGNCNDNCFKNNSIFDLSLPKPIDIDDKVILLIFDFDEDQKKGGLQRNVTNNSNYSGIKVYTKGDIKSVVPENIFKASKVL